MRVHINWRDEPKDDDPASLPWPSSSRNPVIILPRLQTAQLHAKRKNQPKKTELVSFNLTHTRSEMLLTWHSLAWSRGGGPGWIQCRLQEHQEPSRACKILEDGDQALRAGACIVYGDNLCTPLSACRLGAGATGKVPELDGEEWRRRLISCRRDRLCSGYLF